MRTTGWTAEISGFEKYTPMGYIANMHTVVESNIFEAEKARYWSDEEFLEFASWIACNAKAGEVVPGSYS